MTISVNEQVAGHKVTVRSAVRTKSGQRQASCQCGWESRREPPINNLRV
jgi:hypothetical protein